MFLISAAMPAVVVTDTAVWGSSDTELPLNVMFERLGTRMEVPCRVMVATEPEGTVSLSPGKRAVLLLTPEPFTMTGFVAFSMAPRVSADMMEQGTTIAMARDKNLDQRPIIIAPRNEIESTQLRVQRQCCARTEVHSAKECTDGVNSRTVGCFDGIAGRLL